MGVVGFGCTLFSHCLLADLGFCEKNAKQGVSEARIGIIYSHELEGLGVLSAPRPSSSWE